jgi:D-glycero-D-manno-heptose 1,7-bisphosphate phosphatase
VIQNIVILDRDGVINHESSDYIKSPDEWTPIPGSLDAIALLHQHKYRVFVATNQSGIARGLYSEATLTAIHQKMQQRVVDAGGRIDGIVYCQHHPNENCSCRKPKPGLLRQVERLSGESIAGCPFVGDSLRDIEAAQAGGCEPVLVLTGNGKQTKRQISSSVLTFADLSKFADYAVTTHPD